MIAGTASRVKLADCGKSPAGELLAGLASALGSAGAAEWVHVRFRSAGQRGAFPVGYREPASRGLAAEHLPRGCSCRIDPVTSRLISDWAAGGHGPGCALAGSAADSLGPGLCAVSGCQVAVALSALR